MWRLICKWLYLCFAIILMCCFYLYCFSIARSPYNFANDGFVLIKKGSSLNSIYDLLVDKHITSKSFISESVTLWLAKYVGPLKFGEYKFKDRVSLYEVVQSIATGKVFYRSILVVEGEYLDDTIENINYAYGLTGDDITCDDFKYSAVLADTYFYTYGDSKKKIASIMESNLEKFLNKYFKSKHEDCFLSTYKEIVTLASIVEKEVAKGEERPLVASVYLNRLKKNMRLQADPCLLFITRRPSVFWSDLMLKSPYNTYRNKGLPPGPICSPGKESILSVFYPANTNYLFFVSDSNGGHRFSKNFQEHSRKRIMYKKGT